MKLFLVALLACTFVQTALGDEVIFSSKTPVLLTVDCPNTKLTSSEVHEVEVKAKTIRKQKVYALKMKLDHEGSTINATNIVPATCAVSISSENPIAAPFKSLESIAVGTAVTPTWIYQLGVMCSNEPISFTAKTYNINVVSVNGNEVYQLSAVAKEGRDVRNLLSLLPMTCNISYETAE